MSQKGSGQTCLVVCEPILYPRPHNIRLNSRQFFNRHFTLPKLQQNLHYKTRGNAGEFLKQNFYLILIYKNLLFPEDTL